MNLSSIFMACSVCTGDPQSPISKALIAAVVLMILVVGGVLGGIAGTAVVWARRAKNIS